MIEIKEVKTKKEIKQFIEFPLNLYRGNKFFVPPLYSSERDLFKKKNPYSSCSETVYFLAYKDNKLVGRISGIIQKDANKKWNTKNVRFTRFDSIDDQEVSNALFDALSKWAKDRGMNKIQGPLGFNDLEREGLLIEGFDKLSTFEEQYNYPYYQKLIENYGFTKDVDWLEQELRLPKNHKEEKEKLLKFKDLIFKKYNLHLSNAKSIGEFVNKYRNDFFKLLDDTYKDLYGTCPIRKEVEDELLKGFKLLLRRKNIVGVFNEKNEMIAFSLYFSSIAEAVKKSDGKLYPSAIIRILHTIEHPTVLDAGLIGVRDDYKNCGVPVAMLINMFDLLETGKYDHIETNLTLEENKPILNLLSRFDGTFHKKRRAFSKSI